MTVPKKRKKDLTAVTASVCSCDYTGCSK